MSSLARMKVEMLPSESVNARSRQIRIAVRILLLLLLLSALASAENSRLSNLQRQQIIRAFLAENPFVHRALPRGKVGIRIDGNQITPSEAELEQLIAQSGPAAKPGERARITAVRFVNHGIVFEINGGPVKRKKWRDRVTVGLNGTDPNTKTSQTLPTDEAIYTDSTGSSVFLVFRDDVASLTTDQMKDMLAPVLDFKARSVAEAYQKTLPPLLAAAVKNHHALVGMDKDMVIWAMGRPPHRLRETKDNHDYEEWIYGAPPQDVEFIRFLGDKAVSIEDMKVTGEKLVRTQDEVGNLNGTLDASAQKRSRPDAVAAPAEEERRSAPTLLRPDEKPPSTTDDATRDPKPKPAPDPATPPTTGPN